MKLAENDNVKGAILYNLGLVAMRCDDFRRAKRFFRESLKVRPGNARVKSILGRVDVSCRLSITRRNTPEETYGSWVEVWKTVVDEEMRELFNLKVPATEAKARSELCYRGCRGDPPWIVTDPEKTASTAIDWCR